MVTLLHCTCNHTKRKTVYYDIKSSVRFTLAIVNAILRKKLPYHKAFFLTYISNLFFFFLKLREITLVFKIKRDHYFNYVNTLNTELLPNSFKKQFHEYPSCNIVEPSNILKSWKLIFKFWFTIDKNPILESLQQ